MNGERLKPVGFVGATLALWWMFGSAGYVVVKCIPGGDACRFRQSAGSGLVPLAKASTPPSTPSSTAPLTPSSTPPSTPSSTAPAATPSTTPSDAAAQKRSWWPSVTKHDWLVFLSLLTALWVAKVAVYPYEDEPAAR